MALQVSLTLPPSRYPESPDELPVGGGTYPEAYARIAQVRADAQTSYLLVVWYEDAAARERGDDPIHMYEYGAATPSLVGDIYPAAYTYLKTLPDFEGAIDC